MNPIILRRRLGNAIPALGLGVSLLACATLDTSDLDRARKAYGAAQRNPNIDAATSVDLQEAAAQLERAQKAAKGGDSQEIVSHHAYMAETHVKIAQAVAAAKAAQEQAEQLSDQRSEIRLQARARELERAKHLASEAARRADEAGRRVQGLAAQLEALEAQQTERGVVLTLGGVQFGFDQADLKPEAQLRVARLAGFLIATPQREVLVEGHTDSVGSDFYNRSLSQRRADAVRAFLIENGVVAERVLSDGYGKDFPVASNDSEDGRAQNRRVDIVILDPGQAAAAMRRQLPARIP